MVDFVNLLWISVFSFANFECKITAFFSIPQIIEYVIKHKSTKSICDFIDTQYFSSKLSAKKVRKKATPKGRYQGSPTGANVVHPVGRAVAITRASDPIPRRTRASTIVSWSLRRPAGSSERGRSAGRS